MVTLAKRATPSQRRIMRIVEGAVKNTADAHPNWPFHGNIARAIAKRAAGTLSAQWRDVLAARVPPDRAGVSDCNRDQRPGGSGVVSRAGKGERHTCLRRSPLSEMRRSLGIMAGMARKAGNEKRAAAFADALRVLARIEGQIAPP